MAFRYKACLFVVIALAICWPQVASAQVIDTFDVAQTLNVQISGPTSDFDFASGGGILGMERDVELTLNSTLGDADIEINGTPQPSRLAMDVGPSSMATGKVTWDGIDMAPAVNTTGLGSQDLTLFGDRLALEVASNQLAQDVKFTVWSDANNVSEFTLSLPAMINTPQVFEVPFANFAMVPTATGPADFSDVGAVQMEIDALVPNDLAFDLLEIRRPNGPNAIPEPTTMVLLLLSGFGFAMFGWRRGPGGHQLAR